jgi:hypothetical protein
MTWKLRETAGKGINTENGEQQRREDTDEKREEAQKPKKASCYIFFLYKNKRQ